jgi:polysaccharide biosynthesis transport protein
MEESKPTNRIGTAQPRAMQSLTHAGEAPGLREYLSIIWRRKFYLISTLLVIVGLTLAWLTQQTPTYTSQSQVLVLNPSLSPTQGPIGFINMETERSLASSQEVASFAQEAIDEGAGRPTNLLAGLSVDIVPETEILVFTVNHPDPDLAQERAGAFADGYVKYRQEQFLRELLQRSQTVQDEIDSTQAELEEVNEDLELTPEGPDRDVLESRARSLQARLDVLQQSLVPASDQLRVGQVVQPASDPQLNSNFTQRLILAIVMGLALGVGVAFLAERLDDRLRGRQDLERHSTAPVLAVVPKVSDWRSGDEPFIAVDAAPDSPAAEAYRTLRTGVLFAASQSRIKTILITSAEGGEGKSTTAANLGVALARAGKRVILASGDLRRPRLQNFFRLHNGIGLTNVLAGENDVKDALRMPRGISNLKILNSGPVPGNPSELLTSPAMQKVIADLAMQADFILIDGAPVLALADSLVLSRLCDAVIFIAHAHKTSRSAVDQARQELAQVDARLLGSVLNNLDPRKATGYSKYGAYYHAHSAK